MDTKPLTTKQRERAESYRSNLLHYVKDLPEGKTFEEGEISEATKDLGHKVPKMFVREILRNVPGIDQDLLNFGKPNGKVCRTGPVDMDAID